MGHFLDSTIGQYVVQSVFHSVIIAVIVGVLLKLWQIHKPLLRLRFRLLVLLLPLFYFLIYQFLYPQRGSSHFRESIALIDFNQWLKLELWGVVSLGYLFLFSIALAILLFLVQEAMPTIHRLRSREYLLPLEMGQFPKLDLALEEVARIVNQPLPRLFITDQREPLIYAAGVSDHRLVLSPSLIEILDKDELVGVLTHEMAHLIRRDHWVGWALLVLRSLMFYNPVSLVFFRRILLENEEVCDDIAISLTKKPLPFVSGVVKVLRATAPQYPLTYTGWRGWLFSPADALHHHTDNILAEDRVRRLLGQSRDDIPYGNFRLVLTALTLAPLLFFVV